MVVSGHYARVEYDGATGCYRLKKARNLAKDQTYVLYHLTQHQLKHLILPLGNEAKTELRARAEQAGLVNANKLVNTFKSVKGRNIYGI